MLGRPLRLRRRKVRAYACVPGRPLPPCRAGGRGGGRWSEEAASFVHSLARVKAREAPERLRAATVSALVARWTGNPKTLLLLTCAPSLVGGPFKYQVLIMTQMCLTGGRRYTKGLQPSARALKQGFCGGRDLMRRKEARNKMHIDHADPRRGSHRKNFKTIQFLHMNHADP